jgi:CRISPR-associated protein Cmr1
MSVSLTRYHQREHITLNCTLLTPLFLGGADQNAALSTAPLKAALRYWWRVSGVHKATDAKTLFEKESQIFGNADESAGKSQVTVSITSSEVQPSNNQLPQGGPPIQHPEVNFNGNTTVNAVAYLGGMGILRPNGGTKKSYFPAHSTFQVAISYPKSIKPNLAPTLQLFQQFGTLGSRSRNAFGSLHIEENLSSSGGLQKWGSLFQQDYPHGLGKDQNGLLAWESTQPFGSWETAMHALAEAYVKLRTKENPVFAFPNEPTPHARPTNRHLLGYPITKHNVQGPSWGSNGRHASGLRFALKQTDSGKLKIIVLHVPHAFAKEMMSDRNDWGVEKQQKVWATVHQYFDQHQTFQRMQLKGWT